MVSRRSQVVTNTTNITFAADSGLPVFNVKDATYGALGNGSNDDTAEIQAAIDAACAASYYATVFLPNGRYKISAPLTITKPIRLLGESCMVGDRPSNYNYAALGAVIVNASTSTDAIQFTPATVAGVYPRGYGGMVFETFGIDTPDPGLGARVQTYDPTGWGPHSTGVGINVGTGGYYCQFKGVTVCRHYTGFKTHSTSGSCDFQWCNALLCQTAGFDIQSVESRLSFCRAKNNDPEWGPTVDARTAAAFTSANPVLASGTIGLETDTSALSTLKYKVGNGSTAYNSLSYATAPAGSFPAQGTYGFRLGVDGCFLDSCIAICCTNGFYASGTTGFHNVSNCGADSCANPFYFNDTEPDLLSNCWATSCYFETRTQAYPISAGYGFYMSGAFSTLTGCVCKLTGTNGVYSAGGVTGGSFTYGKAVGSARFVGAKFTDALSRDTGFDGTVTGCNLAGGVSGSAGSSKGQANVGVADW